MCAVATRNDAVIGRTTLTTVTGTPWLALHTDRDTLTDDLTHLDIEILDPAGTPCTDQAATVTGAGHLSGYASAGSARRGWCAGRRLAWGPQCSVTRGCGSS